MSDGPTPETTLGRLGYEPRDGEDGRLYHPTGDATPLADDPHGGSDPVPVRATGLDGTDPHRTLATVAAEAAADRVALLVARDGAAAERLLGTLSDPPLVAAETDLGERTFHTGADRVHLREGGLALSVGDPEREPTVEWHEETTSASSAGTGEARTGTDDPRLVLTADGERVTALDGVDALTCPGPSRERFTHHYRRGDDRVFHVADADGAPAGVFSTVRAMRDRGFHPVPAPVVPEHLFHAAVRPPRRSWAVLAPDGVVTEAGPAE